MMCAGCTAHDPDRAGTAVGHVPVVQAGCGWTAGDAKQSTIT